MGFEKSIDARGNRHQRRIVAAIQRTEGKEGRLAAAQTKRQRRMAREFERGLGKTIVFYKRAPDGVRTSDPDGAYLWQQGGRWQMIVIGELKASIDHYVKALGVFLKNPMRLVSSEPLPLSEGVLSDRPFLSMILEPGEH
jgi:hypothetical protein